MAYHCLSQILFELKPLVQCIPIVIRFPTLATNLETSNCFLPVASPVPFILGSKGFQEEAQRCTVAASGLAKVQPNILLGVVSPEHRSRMRNLQ